MEFKQDPKSHDVILKTCRIKIQNHSASNQESPYLSRIRTDFLLDFSLLPCSVFFPSWESSRQDLTGVWEIQLPLHFEKYKKKQKLSLFLRRCINNPKRVNCPKRKGAGGSVDTYLCLHLESMEWQGHPRMCSRGHLLLHLFTHPTCNNEQLLCAALLGVRLSSLMQTNK